MPETMPEIMSFKAMWERTETVTDFDYEEEEPEEAEEDTAGQEQQNGD